MFKMKWEKTSITHPFPPSQIKKIIKTVYPSKKLIADELIAGGCSNLNIKIFIADEKNLFFYASICMIKKPLIESKKLPCY